RHQPERREGEARCDADLLGAGRRPQFPRAGRYTAEACGCRLLQPAALGRQPDRTMEAVEQPAAEILLEDADLPAERGARYPQFTRGVLEAEMGGRGLEGDEAVRRRQRERSSTHKKILIVTKDLFQFTSAYPIGHTALNRDGLQRPGRARATKTRGATHLMTLPMALSGTKPDLPVERRPRYRRVGAASRRVASNRIRPGDNVAKKSAHRRVAPDQAGGCPVAVC